MPFFPPSFIQTPFHLSHPRLKRHLSHCWHQREREGGKLSLGKNQCSLCFVVKINQLPSASSLLMSATSRWLEGGCAPTLQGKHYPSCVEVTPTSSTHFTWPRCSQLLFMSLQSCRFAGRPCATCFSSVKQVQRVMGIWSRRCLSPFPAITQTFKNNCLQWSIRMLFQSCPIPAYRSAPQSTQRESELTCSIITETSLLYTAKVKVFTVDYYIITRFTFPTFLYSNINYLILY